MMPFGSTNEIKKQYFDDKKSKFRQIYTTVDIKTKFWTLKYKNVTFNSQNLTIFDLNYNISTNKDQKNNILTIKNQNLDRFIQLLTLKPNFGRLDINF